MSGQFTSSVSARVWKAHGSRPAIGGQVENIRAGEVVGAVQCIAPHPTDENVAYIAAVNAGVWVSRNLMSGAPTWSPLTEALSSLSIGAVAIDKNDDSGMVVIAGTGRFSSKGATGGKLLGILRSTDGGESWSVNSGSRAFEKLHITSISANGSKIVVGTKSNAGEGGGVFVSADTAKSWKKISGSSASGLPYGNTLNVCGDPNDSECFFADAGAEGIFRSENGGDNWSKVSVPNMDTLLQLSPGVADSDRNVKISVSGSHVFAGIVNSGRLAGLFISRDLGVNWQKLDLPGTQEVNGFVGIHPGGQGSTHFSLVADTTNPEIVYVGGDRQPAISGDAQSGNSLEARDYSGRLFRVDASKPVGQQVSSITHTGTASKSAPHADSRCLALSSNGSLLETDDGGVYVRTSPLSASGDWKSLNGDLQVTEFHSVAWDSKTKSIIGGAQDTGTQYQHRNEDAQWRSLMTGDGGVVAVDSNSFAQVSLRYGSFHTLTHFSRSRFNADGTLIGTDYPTLTPVPLGSQTMQNNDIYGSFYIPFALNRIAPSRLVFGAHNGVFESFDRGDTVTRISSTTTANEGQTIAYGGDGNPDALYTGYRSQVLVRSAAAPATLNQSSYAGGVVVAVAMNERKPEEACVVDWQNIWHTNDYGASWEDITGNIGELGGSVHRSATFCQSSEGVSVAVGTNTGIFVSSGSEFGVWAKVGSNMPSVPVLQLEFIQDERMLLAGTLGRGAWTFDLPDPVFS